MRLPRFVIAGVRHPAFGIVRRVVRGHTEHAHPLVS
jgi:hypothetical protein